VISNDLWRLGKPYYLTCCLGLLTLLRNVSVFHILGAVVDFLSQSFKSTKVLYDWFYKNFVTTVSHKELIFIVVCSFFAAVLLLFFPVTTYV